MSMVALPQQTQMFCAMSWSSFEYFDYSKHSACDSREGKDEQAICRMMFYGIGTSMATRVKGRLRAVRLLFDGRSKHGFTSRVLYVLVLYLLYPVNDLWQFLAINCSTSRAFPKSLAGYILKKYGPSHRTTPAYLEDIRLSVVKHTPCPSPPRINSLRGSPALQQSQDASSMQ